MVVVVPAPLAQEAEHLVSPQSRDRSRDGMDRTVVLDEPLDTDRGVRPLSGQAATTVLAAAGTRRSCSNARRARRPWSGSRSAGDPPVTYGPVGYIAPSGGLQAVVVEDGRDCAVIGKTGLRRHSTGPGGPGSTATLSRSRASPPGGCRRRPAVVVAPGDAIDEKRPSVPSKSAECRRRDDPHGPADGTLRALTGKVP